MEDNIQSVYNKLVSFGYKGTEDDFRNYISDDANIPSVYDKFVSNGYKGTEDDFRGYIGMPRQQQPASRVDVSDVQQAEVATQPVTEVAAQPSQQPVSAPRQPFHPTDYSPRPAGAAENVPTSPYGDLTAENFVAAQQRGKELAEQRKRIQRELDNDTEMEPLTASQRKEYESQLRGLDEEMRGVSSWIDEWNKTEGARAYYEQQKRAVDDVSARIDQMQADRNRERINKRVEEDNKKSWWQRMAEGLASAENPITEEVVEAITDTNNNDLRAARNEVRNAKNQLRLEEMRQNGEQRGLGFLRGMENANYYELMPAIGMADAMSILQLSQDIKDGKELTDSQKLLKEAMEARAGVDFAYQDNNTIWERIGQSAPEQLMFTLQFVIGAGVTGATSAGERVAARSAERAAKRLAKKKATSAARNFVATRVVPELEGMAVSSAIQTFANPLSVAGMVEDFEKRYAGDIYYDKDGNLHVFDNDRSAGQAAYQAIASAWIENFTEYAGGNITKSAKLLDSKMFDLAGKFDNVMKTVGAGKIQDVFRIPQQLGRLTQIGSAPEEFLEEELGSVMNALMATDAQRGESYGEAFKNTISSSFAGEQQLETFLSCAITSMLLGGGGNAVNGVRNAGLRKSVNQDVEQSKALLGKVRGIDIEGLDNMIENGRVSDISAYLKEQSDANNWNKDEQGAAVSYVLNRSRQIGVKHNDDTAIEAEQAEYRRQAEDMVNRWDGQNIYNVTYTDRNGETQEGTIVNGRVHYNTNEDGTYTFDPYMSSGMLAIRRADGSVEQVAGRNVTALNNVATIEEQLESQNQTIDQLMRADFDQDGMLPTIESVWGGNLIPNVTQFQNGRYTYLGQDDNGLYAFANNDKRTNKDNQIVYLTERQLIEYGLSLNLENAQATGDTEAAEKAQEDIDFLNRLDEITADAGAKGQWDVVKAYAQRKVLFDANGGIIPNESNEQATAAYLLAISEGSFENAITSVDQTIAALGTPQQTEVTDNAADNAAINNAAATVDADKARQIDFYTNVRNRLTEMQQGKEEADVEEAEQQAANTPVSQMEVGQQFPVQWNGQPAMATVMGKDADGRSVVTVRDMDGEDIEAGIDDWTDEQWEAVRSNQQEEENSENTLVKVGDRVDVDWGNGTTETVTVRGIEGDLVLITTSDGKPYDFPIGWLSSGQARVSNNSVEITPAPQGPAPAEPAGMEAQLQPVSQNKTPEAAPQQEQPQAEYPKDKQGKPQYDLIEDPNVFAQALVDEWGEDALGALDDIIEDTKEGLELKSKLEQRRINKRLAMLEAVRGMMQPQEEISGNQGGISPNPTVEEVPAEQPTAETSVEQPVAETPQEEAPKEEVPSETPTSDGYTGENLIPIISPDVFLQLYIEMSDKRKKSDVDQKIEEYLYYLNPKAFDLTDAQRLDKTRELVEYANQHQDNEYAKKVLDAVEYIKSPAETPRESAGEGTELTPPGPLSEGKLGPTDEAVAAANEEVDTNPTEAQKEAGNYKKGHVTIDGFDISIENPAGSTRSGTDAQGNPWSVTMHNSYGYIRMTEGVDGDHIDIFLSDHIDDWNGTVYVVDQVNADGSFDEHKVMYGFNSAEEAREAYLSNYSEGWQGLGTITGVSREEFKKWVDSSHRKTKAFADYKSVQTTEGQNEAALATQQTEQETPIQKRKPKKQSDFQQRLDAVGEPRSLEEAILLDIARGGAKFRWGNRDEDKTVTKRGIGDLWKYSQSEFKKRIGILRKDGYSIETYAEAIQTGQLAYLGGHVSQLAERMDMRDLVDAIEDVLHFATSATEALEAIETKRNEEAEEEQRMIQNAMDSEAKEQGFENWDDKEAYIKSLEENNLTDADYEEITRIFAEQYQEDEQRRRTSESEGDSGENQPDERQGVRGADEGGTEVLQGTQAADTGTAEPAGQGTRGESGNIQDAGTPGKNEGAREVRAEIDKLKAQRANLVKQLNDLQKRYENANGLFGDTQADEGDLFGGQNFLSPELAQTTIEGYKRQIQQIDEQIAKLEASLKRASSVKQTEIGGEETKPQWDYDIKIDQKTGHTTIERYTQIEGGMPIFDARWKLEADSPAEMLGIITNPRNGLNIDYFKKFIDILRSYGDRYTTKKAETKKEEPKKNEPQGAATENTIFTEDEYQRRKEALKRRHRTELNIAINPQDFEDLLYMAGYHIERGVRKFADFCKSMIEDLGDWVRPYLQTVYLGAKADDDIKKLGIDRKEWSSEDEVLDFDVDNFDKQQESETGAHQYTDQQKRRFSDAVRVDMRMALERGEKPYRSINDIRKRAESLGMEVDSEGRDDIMLQELVEDGLVRAAREVVESGRYGGAKSKDAFDAICQLYEMQPTISRRSANRVKMGQYSTPLPMSFVADMFAYRRGQKSVLEPTAGNGMLVFAVPAGVVTANELDETRLANLREQGFDRVLNRDATDFDFGGPFDAVIGNPPFGSAEPKNYDGVMIGGLEEQIVLNALQAMADNGRAAFIIGGNMEYAKNGGIAGNKAFWTYLYNHYNVKGVVDMDGKMFSRQGTTFPTRMILIEGRRSAEEIAQSTIYPPVKEKSLRKAESFVDLYDIVKELNDSTNKTNGTEILRTPGAPVVPDSNRPSGETSTQRPRVEPNANVANEQGGPVSTGSTGGTGQTATSGVQRPATTGGKVDVGQRPASVSGTQTSQSGSGTRTDNGNNGGRGQAVLEGNSNGKTGRVSDGSVSQPGNATDRVGLTQQKEQEKRTLTEEKLPYRKHSGARSLESVAPAAMVEAMDRVLSEIEKTYGKSIDEFVREELGYDTDEELYNALAAEQIDSVAMAIHQMKQGNGMIIGDQTGVGKGRQMAALIRWAHNQGKKPVFITQKADLFTDIYRDLMDVGSGDLKPFIFNSDGAIVDSDGNVVHKPMSQKDMAKVFEKGELPDGYDYAVLTYSQVNTGDSISQEEAKNAAKASGKRGAKKSKSDGKPTPKATFLRQIAEDNYLFLDESHTAAGESNTGYYLQSIVRTSKAVTFASATFAKRPDTMPLYAIRTAMSQANVKPNELIGIIQKGGVTLQEIMSRALTEAGQMVRRERDMSDVQTDWETISDPATVKRARENYDKTIEAFNAIIRFQELYIKPLISQLDSELAEVASTANVKKGTNKMGVENTPFASKTYNYTKQLMLALKVDAIVDKVIAEIKAGRHPVIALESTMEASIRDYSPGDIISEPTFSASLLRGLETVMQYTVTDAEGKDTHMRYLPSDLGPEGERAYYELQDFIRESTSDIFISPLDAIIERLKQEGYKVGELTGRNQYVERNDEGKVVVKRRTDKDKKRMQREFNSGELDVLILNKSASTGISLHASERFSDQRQRTMVIAQPLSDINDYMQMIGRIDRTGQVHRGYYINLGLPVPAENRFLMMLATKLKSLNANTTTSQESESNSVEAPDLLNKYGSQVVVEYLRDNPEIYVKMGEPIKEVTVNQLDDYTPPENDEVVRKITGYVALLSTKEQEDFYNDVVRRYIDLIKYLDDTGQNDLKITVMPLRAKTIERRVSSQGVDPNGTNPFAKDAFVETVEIDVLRKPMKADEVRKTIESLNTPKGIEKGHLPTEVAEKSLGERVMEIIGIVQREAQAKLEDEERRYEESKEKASADIEKQREKISKQQKRTEAEKAEAIAKLIEEKNAWVEKQHENAVARIQEAERTLISRLNTFRAGQSVLMPDVLEQSQLASPELASPAIFCGFKAKDSKVTASTTFAVFATLDGRRRIEIKLSDGQALYNIRNMANENYDLANRVTLDNWDSEIPTSTRKNAFILTGNILQAVADTQDQNGNYPGQLISYTDENGDVHDGILMPDKWKPTMMKNSGVPISARLSQIEQGKAVASTDGKVTITKSRWSGSWLLTVPKSKKEGAVYFENPVILKVVGGFWQSRGQFAADINSVEDLRTVVNELANIGVKVSGEQNGGVELSVRTEPAPKKTKKVYKLMRLENGKLYPLFIDRNAMPIELGTWYNADSPNVADLENLEAGYAYKIDGNGNLVERKKVNRTEKGSITGLPNVKSVNSAAEEGARWIAVTTDKSGKKTYHNVGINGSEGVSTYAMRPGWHAGSLPSMRQIGKGPQRNIRDSRFVWVEGEVAADVDYQEEAEQSPTKDIQTHIPTDGYYMKATNADKVKSQADRIGWYISGAFKPNRVISDAEAREVIDEYNAQHPDAPVEYDYEREDGEFTREDAERVNNTAAESKRIAFEAATTALARAGYEVVRATEEDIEKLKKENKLLRKLNGTINGWLGKDGKIYLTESGLNAETAVHEYTHLWAEALQLNDPKLWDEIKTLLKGTPTWNEVKNNPAYAKYDEDRLAEEVLAHLSGRDNGARMEAEAKRMIDEADTMADAAKAASMLNRLKEALKKFWTWVGKNLFGIKGKIDLDTVENMILADLVNGVNPFGPSGGRRRNATEQSFTPAQPKNRIADEYNRMTGANVDGVNGVKRRWEKIARDMFDGLRPLEQMQQLIEKALGRKLRDSEKAYELATQLTSKTGQQIDKEQLSYMVPVLQKVTDIIKLITEFDEYSIEEAYKMVTNYLLAKHGLERNEWFEKQGKKEGDYAGLRGLAESLGENPDDFKAVAERVVNGFEQLVNYNYYGVHTDNLWKTMKALTDRMLEISYDTGMIDKETFEELKKRHKYYVPLRGFADGTAADLFDYVTQSPHFQNIFKKATGRNSMADDPLANLMSMLHSAIVIGNQNEVMQKIYNLAVNSKSDLLRVTKPWYVYDDTTDTWEEKYPDIPEDATADEIDAIVKQFDADMQQKQQQGKAKRKLNRIDVGKKLLPYQAREHEMVAYIDGKRVVMHVAGNPLVAQSMNKSNTQQLNKVMQAIQTATRWYSSINTSWSPAFGPKNAMRDIRMMLFGAYVTGGIRKMWQSSKDVVKAGWALPRLLVTGKMDGGLVKALGPQKAAQLEQWWNEFIDNGGETGFTRTLNAEKAKGEVRDMIRHMLNGSKDGENRVRKYTIGLLEWIGRYSEDISRFAAYCQQRAQGESVLSSIQEAKNVTVNFNVKGGSDLAANMRAMYSFFNASMQGINRMRRLATEHPKRFSSGIAAMMLGGAVLPWLNMALFAMLGGDDDDWRKYEYLSEYTANHNMIIYVGNHKFVSIPWSQELAPFNALGNIWFRQQMGWNKGKSVAEQWGDMFVDLSPISVASGNKPGVGLVKTIMPSFTTPIWEALFNEDFTGSPLYKDNQWNKYDKGWEKAYEGKTSKSVIDASRWLEEKTGIDINPAIAEHLFSGVLGGMGRSGDKLLRYFTNGFQLQDAPFIRTMMFDSKKQGYIGAVQREYGRNAYEVLPEMKAKAEKADAMEFARLVNTEEYKIADVVSKYKTGKDLEGNKTGEVGIDKMEKEYKKIAGMSDGSEEYREQLEEIRNNITERKMEMLDEIQQVKYENSGDLRRYIMDVVNEVERKSKERNGD